MRSDFAVTIIMPVLNEAEQLPLSLASIGDIGPAVQVIVVDGGSTDDSREIARKAGVEVVSSPLRQRAAQMNLGAERAKGDVLLFLHADTQLPPDWRETMQAALARNARHVGGAFRRRFESASLVLKITCAFGNCRGRLFGWYLGDQAMFVRRERFHALGGFAPIQRCEDLDFAIRLSRMGPTCMLPSTVVTSARRFQRLGPIRQTLHDVVTAARFLVRREQIGRHVQSRLNQEPRSSREHEAAGNSPTDGPMQH